MRTRHLGITLLTSIVILMLNGCGKKFEQRMQTCSRCGSVRIIEITYVLFHKTKEVRNHYNAPSSEKCNHIWEDGVTVAVDRAIPNGTVVLVRKGHSYGGFILTDQTVRPENMKYSWFYRTDGKGILDSNDPNVFTGHGEGSRIQFGSFEISWSGNQDGRGFIYYKHMAGDKIEPSDLHICVTDKKAIDGIDASAKEWIYKGSPTDEGS